MPHPSIAAHISERDKLLTFLGGLLSKIDYEKIKGEGVQSTYFQRHLKFFELLQDHEKQLINQDPEQEGFNPIVLKHIRGSIDQACKNLVASFTKIPEEIAREIDEAEPGDPENQKMINKAVEYAEKMKQVISSIDHKEDPWFKSVLKSLEKGCEKLAGTLKSMKQAISQSFSRKEKSMVFFAKKPMEDEEQPGLPPQESAGKKRKK